MFKKTDENEKVQWDDLSTEAQAGVITVIVLLVLALLVVLFIKFFWTMVGLAIILVGLAVVVGIIGLIWSVVLAILEGEI